MRTPMLPNFGDSRGLRRGSCCQRVRCSAGVRRSDRKFGVAMRRRVVLTGLASVPVLAAGPQIPPLQLPTTARQGDVLHGRAPPGATIRIGSLVTPFLADNTGGFIVGLSRDAPPSVTVTSSPVGNVPAGSITL